jgi:rubrerythrin
MDKKELQLLKQAIINEIEGSEFYKLASEKNGISEEVKEAFIDLHNEEIKHIDWLKNLFDKIKNDKEDDFNLAMIEALPSPKLFSWDKLDRKSAALVVSVFGIAIQNEMAAVEFYKNAAASTNIDKAKKLYEVLSKWEELHVETFSKEYDNLLEEWWADQGFEPF